MASYSIFREMLNNYTISDESLNALIGNFHGDNESIGEKVEIESQKTNLNLRSCIINYSQGLIHQLFSRPDSSSPDFHGVIIKTDEYISCIPRLMDFIKSQAVTSAESGALLSQYSDQTTAINDHKNMVDILHSPLSSPLKTGSFPPLQPSPQGPVYREVHQSLMYREPAQSNIDFNPPLSPIRSWQTMEKADVNESDVSTASDCLLVMSQDSEKDLDLSTSFLNMSIIDDTKEDSILLHAEIHCGKETTPKETSEVSELGGATQNINKEICPKILSITSKPVFSLDKKDLSEKPGCFNIQNDEFRNEIPSPKELEIDFNKKFAKTSHIPKFEQDNETHGTCVSKIALAELDKNESRNLSHGKISDSIQNEADVENETKNLSHGKISECVKKEVLPEIQSPNATQKLTNCKDTRENDIPAITKHVTDTKESKDNNCLVIPTDKSKSLVEKSVLSVLSNPEKGLQTPQELNSNSKTIHSVDKNKTDTNDIKNNSLPTSSEQCTKHVVKKVSGLSKPEKPLQTTQELNRFSKAIHKEEKKINVRELKENNCSASANDKPTKHEAIELKETNSNLTKTEKPLSTTPQELKSYLKPFHSEDQKENEDINDPNWGVIRNLETDEERYNMIRKLWKNSLVPDPNEDLTYYGYRKRSSANGTTQKTSSLKLSQKRGREIDDSSVLPIGKRPRRFDDLGFNNRAIDTTLNILTLDYERRTEMCFNPVDRKKIDKRYSEYVNQLRNSRKEAEIILKFYQGLPNQTHMAQKEIEEEQWDIEQVYNLFKRHYRWSGQVFNPIVNKT